MQRGPDHEVELAPEGCIVCRKDGPSGPQDGWTYLSGVQPVGAMACSAECVQVAIGRYERTGRVDAPPVAEA